MDKIKYSTIDLCAGIGGIRRGFELSGRFRNILSAENDKYACITYKHLYGEDAYDDITTDEFKERLKKLNFDVLLAGFPCQTFSAVGKREGFKDLTRGTIFFHLAEILYNNRPKGFLLENVEGLLSHDKGRTFQIILKTLIDELGYKIIGVEKRKEVEQLSFNKNTKSNIEEYIFNREKILLNSKNFGIPQNRPRVYLMGINIRDYNLSKKINLNKIELPQGNDKIIFKNIYEIMDNVVDDKYYLSEGYLETLKTHKEKQKDKGNGFGYVVLNKEYEENPISNALLATGGSGKERNLIYQYKEGVAGKKVKYKKTPVNSEYIRNMTPIEWARLQGFKDYAFLDREGKDHFSFPSQISDTQRYKQLGNSVCIPVIEELSKLMVYLLDNMEENRDE